MTDVHNETPAARPADVCPHPAAHVSATTDSAPWGYVDPAPGAPLRDHRGQTADLDSVRVAVSLGVCSQCSAPVVSARMAVHDHWTVDHGPAWTSPWTQVVRDGQR
jgi:hypothetical protein